MLKNTKEESIFATVLSDGLLHIQCDEGTQGAVKREYETSDGKTGEKWELVYSELSGVISKVKFFEGEFGKSLQLEVTDGDEKPVILSLSTASPYGEDAMKKLLSLNLALSVKIVPYSFTDDNGKNKKGITFYQNEVKIQNYFYDPEAKKNTHGYPEPKKSKKPLSKDEWKLYFLEARMFLVDKVTEHFGLEVQVEETDELNKF